MLKTMPGTERGCNKSYLQLLLFYFLKAGMRKASRESEFESHHPVVLFPLLSPPEMEGFPEPVSMAFGRVEGTSRWEGEQVTVRGPLGEAEEKAELSIPLF